MTDPINTALKAAIANKATGLINKKLGELWERYMTPIFEEMDFSGDREKVKLQYLQYCESLSKFKPLLTTSIVDIDDIYVPLTLKEIGGSSIKFQIDDQAFKQFDKSHNLISGVAGMGKSTALKKILLNTLSEGRFFPIFDELKHYDGGDIYANLARHWERLGITFTNKQIQSMLLSNGTVLFLDAFDEANPKFQEELAEQIQKISISTKCRLICTTRPSTAIFNNNYMREFEIERPSFAQAKEIIRKNSQDEEKAQGLISKLASSTLFKKSNENVMVSPILIILYCASYNLGSDIPDTLHKFYEEIFEVVFLKHDNFKMKVEREYVFNDNKGIYRDLFDVIFHTKG